MPLPLADPLFAAATAALRYTLLLDNVPVPERDHFTPFVAIFC